MFGRPTHPLSKGKETQSSFTVIKASFRKLAKEIHSDVSPSPCFSSHRQFLILAAYEEEEHIAGGKGKCRSRYRSRGWGQQNVTGQGHGQNPSGSSNGVSKPPPGPRMPDGTRGFTMGRGKSAISEPNQNGV